MWSVKCKVWKDGESKVKIVKCGVWSVKHRVWERGGWSVKCKSVECGVLSAECGV